jgi:endo-1,4-beta-xylanase
MVAIAPSPPRLSRAGTLIGVALALGAIASCSSKSSATVDAGSDATDASDTAPPSCGAPTSFAWNSTGVLLSPVSDATHSLTAIKDPSVVYFNNQWHVFASSVTAAGTYSIVYMTFPDWDHTADATFYYMDQTPGFAGYKAAPQVFFFAPQNKWYLIFQTGPPSYSTNDDIGDPTGWQPAQNFYAAEPTTVRVNKGTGGWLDFWVICDDANCFLFFSDDFGHWYRSQTTIDQFPKGFGEPAVVMSDPVASHLFEASNVYKMKDTGKYLALVEAYDSTSAYHRYFRSWTADTLDGEWTALQDTFAAPFASTANVTFTEQPPWTADISHGEMIRDGYDQNLEIDTCHLQYLYQGVDPMMTGVSYNSLPWRLALLTAAP